VIKTLFIKLYELKNPLTLERVSKPIGIRPLNDVAVIEDSTGKRISLDLPEIDNIYFLKSTTFEAPRSPKPSKLLTPRFSKLLKPENKSSKPIFRPPEKSIKPVDSLDPDEMQLDLVTSLCY